MRVVWVKDLFERIDVDRVPQRAVARWKAATDQDVDRFESSNRVAPAGRIEPEAKRLTTSRSS